MTKCILLHAEITVELTYPNENTTRPSVNARTYLSKHQSLLVHDFPILRNVTVLNFKHFTDSRYCPTLQINPKLHGYSEYLNQLQT